VRGHYRPADRDRALRRITFWTVGGVVSAAGLTGAISAVSAANYTAAHPESAAVPVPSIPVEAAPSQIPRPTPKVVVQIIHVPGGTVHVGGSRGISPPRQGPAAVPSPPSSGSSSVPVPMPPPPPPPPVCLSTPSQPC
jgi:hypothetical protein